MTSHKALLSLTLFVEIASASAASLKLTTNAVSTHGIGGAGSFSVEVLSGAATGESYAANSLVGGKFQAFCLEPNETFSPGTTYNYTIDSFAFGNNNEKVGRNNTIGDTLSKGTTWLYSQFARGVLSPYTYTVGNARKQNNLQLQRAFWYLEDDYNGYANTTAALLNPFLALASSHFGTLAKAQDDASAGAYGVWALNLTSGSGRTLKQHQSQLYYHQVPDAASTLALAGLAILGLFSLRRRA